MDNVFGPDIFEWHTKLVSGLARTFRLVLYFSVHRPARAVIYFDVIIIKSVLIEKCQSLGPTIF